MTTTTESREPTHVEIMDAVWNARKDRLPVSSAVNMLAPREGDDWLTRRGFMFVVVEEQLTALRESRPVEATDAHHRAAGRLWDRMEIQASATVVRDVLGRDPTWGDMLAVERAWDEIADAADG